MNLISEFLSGKTHKLARDFLFASGAIAVVCFIAVGAINIMVENMKVAQRQTLPQRIAASQSRPAGEITTITRSVLDDNIATGSISGRPIILDPCTGKEKK
jgi:hypothetical protein